MDVVILAVYFKSLFATEQETKLKELILCGSRKSLKEIISFKKNHVDF